MLTRLSQITASSFLKPYQACRNNVHNTQCFLILRSLVAMRLKLLKTVRKQWLSLRGTSMITCVRVVILLNKAPVWTTAWIWQLGRTTLSGIVPPVQLRTLEWNLVLPSTLQMTPSQKFPIVAEKISKSKAVQMLVPLRKVRLCLGKAVMSKYSLWHHYIVILFVQQLEAVQFISNTMSDPKFHVISQKPIKRTYVQMGDLLGGEMGPGEKKFSL